MKTYQLADNSYVGTQAEAKASGQSFEIVEVPTDKEGLLGFINEIQTASEQVSVPSPASDAPDRPSITDEERTYVQFRADVAAGRVDLDETLLAAPLDTCLRLAGLIYDRLREFKNVRSSVS